jgi:hypothetical protein
VKVRQRLQLRYDRWYLFAAVTAFPEELDADPARVRRLCGWDWITAAIATLPEPLEKAA